MLRIALIADGRSLLAKGRSFFGGPPCLHCQSNGGN